MEAVTPEQPLRRTTRSALAEIPARLSAISVSDRRNGHLHNSLDDDMNQALGLLTPSVSPDELVIRARGRKSTPITWSPIDMNYTPPSSRCSPNKECTPIKNQTSMVTRSTPRKRLLLMDSPDRITSSSPDRRDGQAAKRLRIECPAPAYDGPLHLAMKALSHEQLISVIRNIVVRHPSLEEEIRQCMPAPDLRPIKDRIHELKRNIFKSLPTSRMCSKTDASAYTRAATHLNVFKKTVIEEGKLLASSQLWDCVLEYVVFAWEQVAATPTWDNHLHNAMKRQCFKFLAAQCYTALEKSPTVSSNAEQLAYCTAKFEGFTSHSEEIKACLELLNKLSGKNLKHKSM